MKKQVYKMETNQYLIDFYNNEDNRLISRHGTVEFLTTIMFTKNLTVHRKFTTTYRHIIDFVKFR